MSEETLFISLTLVPLPQVYVVLFWVPLDGLQSSLYILQVHN